MISSIVITQNEEHNIRNCLENLHWVDEIVIVDGGSTDGTIDIIKKFQESLPIKLFNKKFDGHFANQKNLAIQLAQHHWVLCLDSDETLEAHVAQKLVEIHNDSPCDAVNIPRKNYLDDEFQADAYPDYQARFFRSFCRYIYPVHEELVGFRNKIN